MRWLLFKHRAGRLVQRVRTWLSDPDLDVIATGVISTYAGRTALYASIAGTAWYAGFFPAAFAVAGVIMFDTLVHVGVLSSLYRLMQYDLANLAIVEQLEPVPVADTPNN